MILQFGKIPPPIGGISIHVSRLLSAFKNNSIKIELLDYSKERNIISIIRKVSRNKVIHIHLSRKFHRLFIIILFKILCKKVIVTFHGKYDFRNKYDYLSLILSNYSLLLNKYSFDNAQKFKKKNIKIISAFIPPISKSESTLNAASINAIISFQNKYQRIFCTNAWNVVFEENGDETYGGTSLINMFSNNLSNALIFSDPTSRYKNHIIKTLGKIPDNVLFVNYIHDFTDVIIKCDAVIRNTTSDGDSLSVHEALYFGKNVIATEVVDRPIGCILYKSICDLENIINNFNNYKFNCEKYTIMDNITELEKVYRELLLNKKISNKLML